MTSLNKRNLTAIAMVLAFIVVVQDSGIECAAQNTNDIVKVTLNRKRYVGRILATDGTTSVLLQQDGKAKYLQINQIDDVSKYNGTFRPLSSDALQSRLLKSVPKGYEVTNTGNYVVVHPTGKSRQWATPFEKLSKRFTQYFDVRGFDLDKQQFPLVVVVYATRGEFLRIAGKRGVPNPTSVAGFYSPATNQVLTYVQETGLDQQWNSNHLTLIHEALHQYAFNKGIHSRWAQTPRWASEGLAVMFEARGVYDSGNHSQQSDRVHPILLSRMKGYLKDQEKTRGFVARLVESDRPFQQSQDFAYTSSWALMFYLAENQPKSLSSYLKSMSNRPDFVDYDSATRLQDFADHFGSDFKMLEARVIRFIEGL